jgi:hypothetical protein
MKIKKEYIFLAVAIFLLAGYLLTKKTNRLQYVLPTLPTIAKESIIKLELKKGDQETILIKKDGAWFISPQNFPADPFKMDRIIGAISDFSLTALVSESDDAQRYDLTDDKKVMVRVFGEKGLLLSFAVGKRATTNKHTFVTIEGDNRIFQAQGNFHNDFDQDRRDFRDKTILAFAKETLLSMEIVENGKTLVLTKKNQEKTGEEQQVSTTNSQPATTKWVDTTGREIPENVMNQLVDQLSGLQCESFLEWKKKEDFSNPTLSITLKGQQITTLSIFDKADQKEKSNPAVSSANNSPFLLQAYRVELLRKAVKEVRGDKKEAPPTPEIPPTASQKPTELQK